MAGKIYVVVGKTGEYSDRSEWLVTAYAREEDAKTHVLKATEYAAAWHARTNQPEFLDLAWSERERLEKLANPLDPSFSCDYTGTDYHYEPIDLQAEFVAVEAIQ